MRITDLSIRVSQWTRQGLLKNDYKKTHTFRPEDDGPSAATRRWMNERRKNADTQTSNSDNSRYRVRKKQEWTAKNRDSDLHQYSRACSICYTPSPRQRSVFTGCGHLSCRACAESLVMDAPQHQVPILVTTPSTSPSPHNRYATSWHDKVLLWFLLSKLN